MPLTGYTSLCKENASRIVSQDRKNPQKHIGRNPKGCSVSHYQIDGVVLCEETSCDFLLLNDEKKTAYFIELKGSDLSKAAAQLEATEKALSRQLAGYRPRYRIVANKCKTQEVESTRFRKYKIKWGKALLYGTKQIEEEI